MKSNKKFKIATLGCRTNQYESEVYANQLRALGYEEAREGDNADLCIVNTCTVTEDADRGSFYQIRNLKRKHPQTQIVVTGCLVEHQLQKVQSMKEVAHVVSNRKKEDLIMQLFPEAEFPEFSIERFESRTRAYIKIQDGCDSFCTYCILPYVRGRSRSRRLEQVVDEAKRMIQNGFKEIVLTGINIGDFDGAPQEDEKKVRLSDLVRALDGLDGLERLRLSSIDPDEVDEDLQGALLSSKKTCPSLHLVLQSGSNVILKKMNRKYTRQIFLETVTRLKKAYPNFGFTTDVIVGFPGETEEDFEATLQVMREVKFAKVHMFPYSPRPKTRAALYPNRVSSDLMKERKQKVMRQSEQLAYELRNEFIGKPLKVLIEDHEQNDYVSGYSENFLRVLIPKESLKPNDIVNVLCLKNDPQGLIGQVI